MKQIAVVVFSIFMLTALSTAADRVEITPDTDDISVIVEESNDNRIVVRYEIGAFDKEIVDINGEIYYQIECGKENILQNEGEPALPRICRSIIIPDDRKMKISVLSAEYIDFPATPIVPSKGNLPRTVNPDDVPYVFGSVYASSQWYPEEIVSLREPFILRDFRGTVIDFYAFRYHPETKTLRVYTSVTIEVVNTGPGDINIFERSEPLTGLVPDFELIYKRRFINYGFTASRYDLVEETGDMLIITYDDYYDEIVPFVEWKLQKGIPAAMVRVSNIGNNYTSIKNYIQSFYDSTGLAFICFSLKNIRRLLIILSWRFLIILDLLGISLIYS